MKLLVLLMSAYMAMSYKQLMDIKVDAGQWDEYKQVYDKSYEDTTEELLRQSIYGLNERRVMEFNRDLSDELGFELAANEMADISELEILARNGFKPPAAGFKHKSLRNTPREDRLLSQLVRSWGNLSDLPESVDWRQVEGRVSRVKNQGQCGSCWAFASTGVLEGQESKVRGEQSMAEQGLVELSEQNLVDCVAKDAGCGGGLMSDALDFVRQEGGIDSEEAYPYEARQRKCRFRSEDSVLTDAGSIILPEGNEQVLKATVAKFGPVAVAIDASSFWFQLYHKGVYYNKHCKNKLEQLDHAVLVVGYGTDPKKGDYWIVKNSWGVGYGEKGYIRMARNRNNHCGIATVATMPTFSSDYY